MGLFSKSELRAVLIFLPLMLLVVVGAMLVRVRQSEFRVDRLNSQQNSCHADSLLLFSFDPNTIGYDSLQMLGFSKSQALQLLKYREAGKIFRLPEEVDAIYGMTDSLYRRLRPYIVIGEEYRLKPRNFDSLKPRYPSYRREFTPHGEFGIDTVGVEYLRSLGFSLRFSEAFVDCYRRRQMRSLEELREINFIGDSITDLLAPYIIFPAREKSTFDSPIEINSADSSTLCRVYGIGPRTASEIIKYRQRLGGFCKIEQLSEAKGVTEANYRKILQQICCDSFLIQKIDINFAPALSIREHPYMPPRIIRKLISKRQQRKSKGGWSTVEEMVEENILTPMEAERLRPYLEFGTQQQE